jgi:hypothetical protein
MSTTKNVLGILSEAGSIIGIGIPIAGEIIPLATGLVKAIRQIASGTDTVTYEILIQADSKELDAVHQLAEDDLAAINAELAKLGKPPIASSAASPAAPPATADPAPPKP